MTDDFLEAMKNSAGGSGEWSAPPAFGLREFNAQAARIAALEAALKPVAVLPILAETADDVPVFGLDGRYITHGDIRRARAALAVKP